MFPTPNPRNGLILSPVRQGTILQILTIRSHGVMATRLTSNQKILGSTPSVSVFALTFLFSSHSPFESRCLVSTMHTIICPVPWFLNMSVTGTECTRVCRPLFANKLFTYLVQVIKCLWNVQPVHWCAEICYLFIQNSGDTLNHSADLTVRFITVRLVDHCSGLSRMGRQVIF